MKTINAFLNLQNFIKSLEIINFNLRNSEKVEQFNAVRDYFINIEKTNLVKSFRVIAEVFLEKADTTGLQNVRGMYTIWSHLISDKVDPLELLQPQFDVMKEIADIGVLLHTLNQKERAEVFGEDIEALTQSTECILKGAQIQAEDFQLMSPQVVHIFKTFVMPEMATSELQPEVDGFPDVNPN